MQAKSKYGDTDFTKEDFHAPTELPMGTGQPYTQNTQQTFNQGSLQNQNFAPVAPFQQGIPAIASQAPVNLAETAQSLSPDDMLFMRSWRQDSFYYRVLPLTVLANGGLYYYYKSRNLPHLASRYIAIGGLCYIIGKWSYKDELKRRAIESPLNTPYMQALRKILGVQSIGQGEFTSDTMAYGQESAWSTSATNEDSSMQRSQPFYRATPPVYNAPMNTSSTFSTQNNSNQNSDLDGESKPTTSYEELRAKNRGLIR